MQIVVGLLLMLSVIFLVVGLIKPSLIIRWGSEERKTRKAVAGMFFFVFVGLTIILCLTTNTDKENKKENNVAVVEKNSIDTGINPDADVDVDVHEDGSITKVYSKGLLVVEETKAYRDAVKEKTDRELTIGMTYEEAKKILGDDKVRKVKKEYDKEKIKSLAEKYGYLGKSIEGNFYNVKKSILGDKVEWAVSLRKYKDIRKENPDKLVAEIQNVVKKLEKDLPDHSKIQVQVMNDNKERENMADGDLYEVYVVYYRDLDALVKFVSRIKYVDGQGCMHGVQDVIQ